MMMGKEESESLQIALNYFFKKDNIKKTFKFIGENNITGCEKWFQIELMKFLCEQEYVAAGEVFKEEPYDYDKRKEKNFLQQKVDLTFRMKNKRYFHALEIKHKNILSLSDVEWDLSKLPCALPSQNNCFRKVFSLLIHPHQPQNVIEEKVSKKCLQDYFEFTLKIPTSNLVCSVFSRAI